MYCHVPWSRITFCNQIGSYCCCMIDNPSILPKLSPYPDHSISQNGDLWATWNSQGYQQIRKMMTSTGAMPVCGNAEGLNCSGPYSPEPHLENLTEIQEANYNRFVENFNNKKYNVDHYPTDIEFIMGYNCNLKCEMCCQKELYDKVDFQKQLPIKQISDELVEFCKRAINITILGGEATILPNYQDFINIIRQSNNKMNIITNGHTIIDKIIPYIDTYKAICVSIDAANSSSYKLTRKSANQNLTWENLICNLEALKTAKENNPELQISFFFCINGYNYKEIPLMIQLAHDYHAENVFLTETVINKGNISSELIQQNTFHEYLYNKSNLELLLNNAKILSDRYNITLNYAFRTIRVFK